MQYHIPQMVILYLSSQQTLHDLLLLKQQNGGGYHDLDVKSALQITVITGPEFWWWDHLHSNRREQTDIEDNIKVDLRALIVRIQSGWKGFRIVLNGGL